MSSLYDNLEKILVQKIEKIIPENIKKDVQIFNVVGTLEPGIITEDEYNQCVLLSDLIKGTFKNIPTSPNDHYFVFSYYDEIYCMRYNDTHGIGYENGVQENLVWYSMETYKFFKWTDNTYAENPDINIKVDGSAVIFYKEGNITPLYSDIALNYDGYWSAQLQTDTYFSAKLV